MSSTFAGVSDRSLRVRREPVPEPGQSDISLVALERSQRGEPGWWGLGRGFDEEAGHSGEDGVHGCVRDAGEDGVGGEDGVRVEGRVVEANVDEQCERVEPACADRGPWPVDDRDGAVLGDEEVVGADVLVDEVVALEEMS